jgi:[ribosomal protein S5]-alanine N-acetyltransferase
MKVERVESLTDIANIPSQRVLEKSGFKKEGVLQRRSRIKSEWRDEYMYSLMKEDRL